MVLYSLTSKRYHSQLIKINPELWNECTLPHSEQEALVSWLICNCPAPNDKIWENIQGYKLLNFKFFYNLFRGVMMFATEAFKPVKTELVKKRRELLSANINDKNIYALVHQLATNMKKAEDDVFVQYLARAAMWANIGKETFHRNRTTLMKVPEYA
jgi:hypothetical protein